MPKIKRRRLQFKLFALFLIYAFEGCSVAPYPPLTSFPHKLIVSSDHQEEPSELQVYRGVFHVHTTYSHDSSASLKDAVHAAANRHLDFVVITDHNTLQGKQVYEKSDLKKLPLLIFGNEISTTDGHLISLGTNRVVDTPVEPQQAIRRIHADNGFAILAHPVCDRTAWRDWRVQDFDGIEVYNYACNFYETNKITFALKSLLFYPGLFTRLMLKKPHLTLTKWDSLMAEHGRPIPALGAVDAHVRYHLLGFPLMRYSLSFRAVTMYIHANVLNEKNILNALAKGNSFIVFETLGTVSDFLFQANTLGKKFSSGSLIASEAPVTLTITLDKTANIRLIRNGRTIAWQHGKTLTLDTVQPGSYRAEVYRHEKLWIISNPIMIQG